MDKLIEESKKDFEGVEYFADILRCLRKILNKYNLSIEYFVSFARANMDTLKTAQELDKIFNKIVLDEREWGELVGAVKANWNKGNIFDKGIQTQQQREIDKTDEYREQYKDKLIKCPLIDTIYNKETDFKYCKYGVLKSYLQNEIKRKNEKAEKMSKSVGANRKDTGKEITYKLACVNGTDEKGAYYLKSNEYHRTVFMSVPAGYEAVSEGVLPKFHRVVDGNSASVERADWNLVKVDNADHIVYVLGDLHLANRSNNNDLSQFDSFMDELNKILKNR